MDHFAGFHTHQDFYSQAKPAGDIYSNSASNRVGLVFCFVSSPIDTDTAWLATETPFITNKILLTSEMHYDISIMVLIVAIVPSSVRRRTLNCLNTTKRNAGVHYETP